MHFCQPLLLKINSWSIFAKLAIANNNQKHQNKFQLLCHLDFNYTNTHHKSFEVINLQQTTPHNKQKKY